MQLLARAEVSRGSQLQMTGRQKESVDVLEAAIPLAEIYTSHPDDLARFAAAALVGTMLTAINRVHLKAGPWASNGGYEYNLVLIFAVLALTETGPGALSLDAALGQEKSGTGWALAAAGAGVAGAVGVHILAEATPAPQESPAAA